MQKVIQICDVCKIESELSNAKLDESGFNRLATFTFSFYNDLIPARREMRHIDVCKLCEEKLVSQMNEVLKINI